MTYTEAEYELLYESRGQRGVLRDGFTGEQAERMFKRRDASERAARTPYQDGTSMKQCLDNLIADGFTHIIRSGRWMYLTDYGSSKPRLDSKVERDYVMTALNLGVFKRNY